MFILYWGIRVKEMTPFLLDLWRRGQSVVTSVNKLRKGRIKSRIKSKKRNKKVTPEQGLAIIGSVIIILMALGGLSLVFNVFAWLKYMIRECVRETIA
jgi:polyferredoxin